MYQKLKDGLTYGSLCRTVIDFPTPLMCPQITEVDCSSFSTEFNTGIDLNPLSSTDHNYVVNHWSEKGEPVRYILNVCRNLLHQKGITCPPDAAVCAYR